MKSSAWLGINHIMTLCAIYNFLLTEIENTKANESLCSVSLFLIYASNIVLVSWTGHAFMSL